MKNLKFRSMDDRGEELIFLLKGMVTLKYRHVISQKREDEDLSVKIQLIVEEANTLFDTVRLQPLDTESYAYAIRKLGLIVIDCVEAAVIHDADFLIKFCENVAVLVEQSFSEFDVVNDFRKHALLCIIHDHPEIAAKLAEQPDYSRAFELVASLGDMQAFRSIGEQILAECEVQHAS